jgi:predicted transcriptional regulator
MASLTEARQKAQNGKTYIDETKDDPRTVSDVQDPESLADLLGDECARTILVEAKKEPRSAAELSDCAGVSEPTVYRRLERLREYDLVTEDIQPVTNGKNYKLYRTELDGIELDLSEDGFEITVSRRERMVDRFTEFVEGN